MRNKEFLTMIAGMLGLFIVAVLVFSFIVISCNRQTLRNTEMYGPFDEVQITDDKYYSEDLETNDIDSIRVRDALAKSLGGSLSGNQWNILSYLQSCHDNWASSIDSDAFPAYFKRHVAKRLPEYSVKDTT